MCGIAGFLLREPNALAEMLEARARRMADTIAHRGPDSSGYYTDAVNGLALAQRRLAIIDLSPAGFQPMTSACGRYTIVYNGEVYNHEDLRPSLNHYGIKWRGHSDTEVILEMCAHFGVASTVPQLIGMFAFALWDKEQHTLTLVRDRVGVKPLYWTDANGTFAFASELKAILAAEFLPRTVRPEAIADFLRQGYIQGTHSIWQNIHKLAPGHILTWHKNAAAPALEPYWDLRELWQQGASHPSKASEADLQKELHNLLRDAVKRRMLADVPLGAFLSGGIDSSLVVSLMQEQASAPVKTFTIGFHEAAYNEAEHAKAVAQHLGTDHTEFYLSEREALDVIPLLPDMYDEPFADHSQIPTYLVSKIARTQVKVALSGDGGDEFFGGYNRYTVALGLAKRLQRIPTPLRKLGAATIQALTPESWSRLGRYLPHHLANDSKLGDRLYKLKNALGDMAVDNYYGQIISHWTDPYGILQASTEKAGPWWQSKNFIPNITDPLMRMQLLDALVYLPDDVMTKVDRASMATSLESREPLLDHRLIAFASHLPAHMKVRHGQGKWLLRQVLYQYVPTSLIDRPKAGFGVPIGQWLRGPLRDWAEDLLSTKALAVDGIFQAAPIREKWQQHLSGQINWEFLLWDILMFQSWRRRWLP